MLQQRYYRGGKPDYSCRIHPFSTYAPNLKCEGTSNCSLGTARRVSQSSKVTVAVMVGKTGMENRTGKPSP